MGIDRSFKAALSSNGNIQFLSSSLLRPLHENPADRASRRLFDLYCTLAPHVWRLIDETFGPHSVDLMAIPANVRCDLLGRPLAFFSPFPLQAAAGTNVFSQVLPPSDNANVFPPFCGFRKDELAVRETPKVDINIDAINGRLKKTILTKDRI